MNTLKIKVPAFAALLAALGTLLTAEPALAGDVNDEIVYIFNSFSFLVHGVHRLPVLHSPPMSWIFLIAVVGPFAVSVAATYVVRSWSLRRGFVDRPSGHKRHGSPVALSGGIALFIAICLPILAGTFVAWALSGGAPPSWLPAVLQPHMSGVASKLPVVLAIVAGALVLHVVGLIDDRRPLGPWFKLAAQLVVALFTAWPMSIRAMEALPAPLSVGVTVVWLVLITNAFNFLDNMDGLSAGVAAIAAAIFAVASLNAGQIFVPVMALVVVGALVGFLFFNFSPAAIFMGDAGSLVIGYLMGVLTVESSKRTAT